MFQFPDIIKQLPRCHRSKRASNWTMRHCTQQWKWLTSTFQRNRWRLWRKQRLRYRFANIFCLKIVHSWKWMSTNTFPWRSFLSALTCALKWNQCHDQVKKEDLQLIGAVTCLISCKVFTFSQWTDEFQPPLHNYTHWPMVAGGWADTADGWRLPLCLWWRLFVRISKSLKILWKDYLIIWSNVNGEPPLPLFLKIPPYCF